MSDGKEITKSKQLWVCLMGNFTTLIIVITLAISLNDGSSGYFKMGPGDDLILVSLKINTWTKWGLTLLIIGVLRICDVWVNEIGSPILGFNIYNPDKTHIVDFSKNELNFLANAMWSINSVRGIFMTVIAVTQFDLAFASVIVSEIASIFTIRMLLNAKTFGPELTELDSIVIESNSDDENSVDVASLRDENNSPLLS